MPELASRIEALRLRIRRACERADRPEDAVELLPVSKRQPLEVIQAARQAGFLRFGENYVQEGAAKAEALPEVQFLLLGPLQKNKVKPALQHFHEILSLDRPELASRLGRIAEELGLVRPVWIQVDLWDESTKVGGCPEAGLESLLQELAHWPALPLKGFMALPPPELASAFPDMARLREAWQQRLGRPLSLSMGMSDDLEAAILSGTDQVRIGTALFGSRPPRNPEISDLPNI